MAGNCWQLLATAGNSLRCQAARVLKEESGTHISMDRLRSRAPRGLRAYGTRCPREQGQEPDAYRFDEPVWDGRIDVSLEGARTRKPSRPTSNTSSAPLAPSLREGQLVW
jgi:hypothetical protein